MSDTFAAAHERAAQALDILAREARKGGCTELALSYSDMHADIEFRGIFLRANPPLQPTYISTDITNSPIKGHLYARRTTSN